MGSDKKKHKKKEKKEKLKKKKYQSSSSSSDSDEWVEKGVPRERDDWMSMTGVLKTFTKDKVTEKANDKSKNQIDSYDPSTSTRELNPYWKHGGKGVPKTTEEFHASKAFMKPIDEYDYYSKPSNSKSYDRHHTMSNSKNFDNQRSDRYQKTQSNYSSSKSLHSGSWKKSDSRRDKTPDVEVKSNNYQNKQVESINDRVTDLNTSEKIKNKTDRRYLSDEKMNKLAAKIVKAEIMGDMKTVNELKDKLEKAREYRAQNPDAGKIHEDEKVMLTSTNIQGNSRPLAKTSQGDARSKSGKRKAETHTGGERFKYFGNDDKYNLAQMFEQEKYGTNYDNDAQLANIVSKHKNPNDDLEDIFTDEISKNRNDARDDLRERDRAIKQNISIEKSLDGCQYCVGSRNMLKHLMISCGNKVYLALPSKQSLVEDHCIITTVQHTTCVTSLDEDVWEEILDYRKALTKLFNSQGKDVVFYETAIKLHKFPHMVINCIPLPRDVGDMAAIYFKKALLECEGEWAMNKKVVDLKGKNIRKGIPKGLPYFWVDFGMDPGFAHVIEDQHLFPKAFAEEIIGGILDLDHCIWKNPQKEHGEKQRKKVLDFLQKWKKFDTVSKK